ncbi:gliding motility-associated C-terminal domain-containing protein [Pontibacter rugosus]|uniref:Gliding motility-associated C-terminal domain-containing protein n=1 Tax=Pontibacter rugosus TaxID=1745966 RepID=A0ABW3ST32_9BACT
MNFCEGDPAITLTATLGENIQSYEWYKDGVQTGNTTSSIAVSETGSYYIIAIVNGCGDDLTAISNRIAITYGQQPVSPAFSTSPDASTSNLCSGDEIVFSLQAPNVTGEVAYEWNFGDNTPLVRTTGSQTVAHTFESLGTGIANFTVNVTAINQTTGCTSTYTQTISILQAPDAKFTVEGENPDGEKLEGCLPEEKDPAEAEIAPVIINNTQGDDLNDILEYYIDWGAGNGEEPTARVASDFPVKGPVYEDLGVYIIKIRTVDRGRCSNVIEVPFEYLQKPKAGFNPMKNDPEKPPEIEPGIGCRPVYVTMGETEGTEGTPAKESTGGGLTYEWEITSPPGVQPYEIVEGGLDQKDLKVIFFDNGVYQIKLIVTNACGTDESEESVVVGFPQAQLPASAEYCGPTDITYGQGGTGAGGGTFFDPNFGNDFSVTWTITDPDGTVTNRTGENQTISFTKIGTYKVRVLAENECGNSDFQGPVEQLVTILPPLTKAPTVADAPPACIGGTTTLRASGPVPGLTYNWYTEPTGGTPVGTGTEFTTPALASTTNFYVEGVNTSGCISPRATVIVNVVPGITNNTINADQNICVGDKPAELEGSDPSGGSGANPTFTWEQRVGLEGAFEAAPGVNNNKNYTPGNISELTFFRRVVRSGDCEPSISNTVQITAVPRIENNTISAAQEICEGETPAQLTGVRPTGGDEVNYSIIWEVSTAGPEEGFVPAPGDNAGENYDPGVLTQDSWFRRVVESNGCRVASIPVKITVYDPLDDNTISAETTEICTGTTPAPLTGTEPTGGSGAYTYLWESSTIGSSTGFAAAPGTNTGRSYSPGRLSTTTWFRRTVGSAACRTVESNVVQITVSPAVRNNTIVATQEAVCTGQVAAQITGSTPTNGAGGYTYLWESSTVSATTGFVRASGTNDDINYTPTAINRPTWFHRVVFSGGCSDTSEPVAITVLPIPAAPTLVTRNAIACVGGTATLAVANPNGLEYRWYTSSSDGSPVFIGAEYVIDNVAQTTTYYVEAVNENECISTTRTPATVTAVPVEANAGEDAEIIQGQPVALTATGGATYVWEPAASLSNPNIANPVARPQETTTYTVTVTTAEGCVDTDEVTITVIPALRIPNAFTPNGDSFNEVWEIENFQNYPDMRVEVFNRWGNKIFSSKGYSTPWDGTYNGKLLPVATYYYLIYLDGTNNDPISGNVTIIR